eukprot:2672750-Ditylum_brightwellii.AAC.1
MTYGRTGTLLMTNTVPDKLKEQVIYIAIRTWIGMGFVLHNEAHHKVLHGSDHGKTTGTNYSEATKAISAVLKLLDKKSDCRAYVLSGLRTEENEAWGKGVFIFCTVVKNSPIKQVVFKGRYLPMLTETGVAWNNFESSTCHTLSYSKHTFNKKSYFCGTL